MDDSFRINLFNVDIDHDSSKIIISAPYDFDLSKVYQYTETSPFSTVSPESGNLIDFRQPVLYTVTAQDGSTKDYTVSFSRRTQLPVEILIDPFYSSNRNFCK